VCFCFGEVRLKWPTHFKKVFMSIGQKGLFTDAEARAVNVVEPLLNGEVRLSGVSKAYDTFSSEWERIAGWFGFRIKPKTQSIVLKNLSVRVMPGEALGIIGQNGSGKSTLLKIITGTLAPSTGVVERAGRVAALLELGLGFNIEFSGRQNAASFLAMIGCPHSEINSLVSKVEIFAEIGDYFDQPVRTYSSGMHMRVAFAAATVVRPDLLIVDEALAVGDSYFVHKCMALIREFRSMGTTLLFVSHDPGSVRLLCTRAILLSAGEMVIDGAPDQVCDYYNALIAAKENTPLSLEQKRKKDGWLVSKSGTGEATFGGVEIVDAATGSPLTIVAVGQEIEIACKAIVGVPIERLVNGIMIRTKEGLSVWGTNTALLKSELTRCHSGETVKFTYRTPCNLGPGSYSVSVALTSSETHLENNFEWIENVLVFDVANLNRKRFVGTTYLPAKLTISRQDKDALTVSL
jgi:lipopolysaccharide transport system ATP-binding protein